VRTIPERRVELPGTRRRIITTLAEEFSIARLFDICASQSSFTWPGANDPVAFPFVVTDDLLVDQLGWANGGGTPTDGIDVGIYTTEFARLVSGGGTTRAGANIWQWVDVADTWLPRGRYYLAASNNGVTATQQMSVGANYGASVFPLALAGVFDSTTDAYPLPDPLTNMALVTTFNRPLHLAIAGRAPF